MTADKINGLTAINIFFNIYLIKPKSIPIVK